MAKRSRQRGRPAHPGIPAVPAAGPGRPERGGNVHHHYHSPPPPQGRSYDRLYRSTSDKWIAGVCGGLARHFNMDPVLVRVLWIVLLVFSLGIGIIAYLLMWLLVDKEPYSYYAPPPQGSGPESGRKVHYHYHQEPARGGRRR